ncbi:putative Branchpoint-bridging protein [Seiridium unicorne]|uniref:Branchpoint-bridging protein n=1 Tax=Seiridium unicorne TaxID=138068 RepID=A0ABR2V6W9_9PEZI
MPNYRPPPGYTNGRAQDWRSSIKAQVYIPANDIPEVNFIGQILGRRGRSLADMNDRSAANIVIRGRGSVKEGKGKTTHRSCDTHEQLDEPLHCLITADAQAKVDAAKELVQAVIEAAISTAEHANERKREQLRNLAIVNGAFRNDEGRNSYNDCARLRDAPGSASITRAMCSGGHIPRDCPDKKKQNLPWSQPSWRAISQQQGTTDAIELACDRFLLETRGSTA